MKPEFNTASISLGVFVGSLAVVFLFAASLGYLAATGRSQPSAPDLLPMLLMAVPIAISARELLRLRVDDGVNGE